MHFDSFFRQFFGPLFPSRSRPSEDENEPDGHPTNDMFGAQLNAELEQLDQLMTALFQESFSMFRDLPTFQETPTNSENYNKPLGSLRDQMLKPSDRDLFGKGGWEPERSSKADMDLDERVKNGSLDVLLPKAQDDGMHYSTRSSMNYYHSSNGATETKSTANDREGCHKELITKEFDGKKYVLEKRRCPGASEQITETLVNLSREELPEFLKNWKIDNSTGNQDMFFNFFGSLR